MSGVIVPPSALQPTVTVREFGHTSQSYLRGRLHGEVTEIIESGSTRVVER